AVRAPSAEDTANRRPGSQQLPRAGDDRCGFLLDVAEMRKLLRQLDEQRHRWDRPLVSDATGGLEDDGTLRDPRQRAPILAQIVFRPAAIRRSRDDRRRSESLGMAREGEHLLGVLSLHAEAESRAHPARCFRQYFHPAEFLLAAQEIHAVA